jgi:hypothetical protein
LAAGVLPNSRGFVGGRNQRWLISLAAGLVVRWIRVGKIVGVWAIGIMIVIGVALEGVKPTWVGVHNARRLNDLGRITTSQTEQRDKREAKSMRHKVFLSRSTAFPKATRTPSNA